MKRIPFFLSGLLFFFFLACPVTTFAARTVNVGVYDFKPLIFLDEKKDPAGLFIDVLKHVARKEGWQVHYVYGTWKETYEGLLDGKLDLVACIGITAERAKKIDFSPEHLFLDWGVIYSRPGSGIENIFDLKDKKVAVLAGSVYTEGLKHTLNQFDIAASYIEYKTYTDVFSALEERQADAGVATSLNGSRLGKETKMYRTQIIFSPTKLTYAVRKGMNNDLVQALEREVAALKADHESLYYARYEYWISGLHESKTARHFLWVITGLLIAGLLLFIWNIMLKYEVTSRTEHLEKEIAQRNNAEQRLAASEILLQTLVRNIPDLVWLKDPSGIYLKCNHMFERFFGHREADIIGKTDYDFVDKELADFFREHDRLAAALGRPNSNEETVTFADDGHRAILETTKTPMFDGDGRLLGVLGIARDITARKQAEERLKEVTQRLEHAISSGGLGVWDWDVIANIMVWNDRMFELYGADRESFPRGIDAWTNRLHPDDRARAIAECEAALRGDREFNTEFRVQLADGTIRWLRADAVVIRDDAGKALRMTGLNTDISAMRTSEKLIRIALNEKETLLKELYHRTKNNMQVISSLLNLQSAQLKDRGMIQIFHDTRNRIQAMSLVHEKLYQSQDLSSVDFSQYARDLAMTLLKSYRTGDSRITLEFDIAFIPLSIDTITPLGLILNELIANSLKYAFPADRQGTIRISARAYGKGDIEFLFSDNGIGLPAGFDPHHADSLGMQLIHSLAESQLCGRLEVSPCKGGGTEFRIWFNDGRENLAT